MVKLLSFLLTVIEGRELLTEFAMFVNLYPHAYLQCEGLTSSQVQAGVDVGRRLLKSTTMCLELSSKHPHKLSWRVGCI